MKIHKKLSCKNEQEHEQEEIYLMISEKNNGRLR
jgi:hypothetical protein